MGIEIITRWDDSKIEYGSSRGVPTYIIRPLVVNNIIKSQCYNYEVPYKNNNNIT